MSICSKTLAGIASDCGGSMGGIQKVWIASPTGALKTTLTDNKISAITIEGSTLADEFKFYYFKKNTASMTSTFTIDAANGTSFVQTDLSMVFGRMETAKRIEIQTLAMADCYVVVKDSNGKYWFLGYDEAVNMSAGTGESGTNKTDRNAYACTLTDSSVELPFELTDALAESFEAIV